MSPASHLFAYACLALSMSLVGSYVALSKELVAAIPIFLLAWIRFGIGLLAVPHWLRKPADEPPLSGRTRWLLFLESFLGNVLFTVCMLFGVSLTSATSAGVIMASIPAVVALLSWKYLGEAPTARVWVAVACAMGSIALLATPDGGGSPGEAATAPLLGNLLVLGAVFCEASYAVIGKKLTQAMGPKRITALINLWGFALITPFGLTAALRFDFSKVALPTFALLVFYSLAASVWTVWLWMRGMKVVPASHGGIFTVMLPISATLVDVFVLDQPLAGAKVPAFALALTGILFATVPAGIRPGPSR